VPEETKRAIKGGMNFGVEGVVIKVLPAVTVVWEVGKGWTELFSILALGRMGGK